MINEKEMIETYIREEDTVKKKTFVEFYKLFYERAKNKDPYPILRLHPYCRFVYKERWATSR